MQTQKRLAARLLKTSPQKIRFQPDALEEIQKAITRSDIRGLIAVKKITELKTPHHSRGRARKLAFQKRKGRRRSHGSRKGCLGAKVPRKTQWLLRVRLQRKFLKELREKKLLSPQDYRQVYLKIKGGFFRNKRHLKLYLEENKLLKK